MDGAALCLARDEVDAGEPAPVPATVAPLTAGLDRLPAPEAWDALATHAAEPNPFYERWFLRPSFRHLGQAGTRLLTVWEGERLIGLMPVGPQRRYAHMPLRLATNWAHYHLFLGTPLVRKGREEAFWAQALPALDALPETDLIHLSGLVEGGPVLGALLAVSARTKRPAEIVHRAERALYAPSLDAQAYYEAAVRKKKRKEIARLRNRLAELGEVRLSVLGAAEDVGPWAAEFLTLEAAGWKGEGGSALGNDPRTRAFFADMTSAAHHRGLLDFVRLDVGGRTAAMLCTLLGSAGAEGFSYKIAYDEALARFSPGVLLQAANLDLPARRMLRSVDSCAAPDHPMIDSLWTERRAIVRVTIARATRLSRATFRLARAAERGAELWRARKEPA